jgi:hypothetical protein
MHSLTESIVHEILPGNVEHERKSGVRTMGIRYSIPLLDFIDIGVMDLAINFPLYSEKHFSLR